MSTRTKQPKKPVQQASQVRIIGGKWRSRKLSFPPIQGLRPTPDRVRETLFNWLQNTLPGARCLDLFAGSGALGIEALSRGAKNCTFVDLAPQSCQSLKQNLSLLECSDGKIVQGDALAWLQRTAVTSTAADNSYNVIFMDPPFNGDFCQSVCQLLIDKNLLADDCYIYIETELQVELTLSWTLHREKISGQVRYRLYKI